MSKPKTDPITGQERAALAQTIKNYGAVAGEVDDLMTSLIGSTRQEAAEAVKAYIKQVKGY